MFDLTGRTALVTGATGGIGGAIAQALHAQGATVAISGTRREVLDSFAGKLGERVHVLPCNLADSAEVEALVPAAEAAWIEIFQNDVMASATATPATIAASSAKRARGASSQRRTTRPATAEASAMAMIRGRCSRREMW